MRYASISDRLDGLGSTKWAVHIEGKRRANAGQPVIMLSIGEPDLPPPAKVIEQAITSLRDGMNLVALEYVAAQEAVASAPGGAAPGLLVLSEFTGAATCTMQKPAVLIAVFVNFASQFYLLFRGLLQDRLHSRRHLHHAKNSCFNCWFY